MGDKINPDHYKSGSLEVIEVIEEFDLTYNLGNACKYLLRAGKKKGEDKETDLKKLLWYVQREIDNDEESKYYYSKDDAVTTDYVNSLVAGNTPNVGDMKCWAVKDMKKDMETAKKLRNIKLTE